MNVTRLASLGIAVVALAVVASTAAASSRDTGDYGTTFIVRIGVVDPDDDSVRQPPSLDGTLPSPHEITVTIDDLR